MNSGAIRVLLAVLIFGLVGCSSSTEPDIIPPQPRFADASQPGSAVDHRIFADVDAQHNAIVVEWRSDSTNNTSGYTLYRATDSTVGADGLLLSKQILAQFESSNSLGAPLPTSYQDTLGILPGGTFWYQLQAFYRSPTNKLTYSSPTAVDRSTSFQYAERLIQNAPAGQVVAPPSGLQFRWANPDRGGNYQIIVQRTDNQQFVWSYLGQDYQTTTTLEYPSTAIPLIPGVQYRWRVKRVVPNGGSTSSWMTFNILP